MPLIAVLALLTGVLAFAHKAKAAAVMGILTGLLALSSPMGSQIAAAVAEMSASLQATF